MASLSTHVLDSAAGGPRAGVAVTVTDGAGRVVGRGLTGADGRIPALAEALAGGTYELAWDTGGSFVAAVSVRLELTEDRHYHVPLLVSEVAATTYLGV